MGCALPSHVAIIMDGNGRWAEAQGKERAYGHYRGTENVRNIAIAASHAGIKYLTLYAFSTENWIRPEEEVKYLMGLPAVFFKRFMAEIMANDIRIRSIGELDAFPEATRRVLEEAIAQSRDNHGLVLTFAMNYGSRREIILALRQIIREGLSADQVDEQTLNEHLMTAGFPDVDLLIRTSGEQRLSNFLLWQCSYAELYFTKTCWPEFSERDLQEALAHYAERDRRFGGIKE